MRWIARIVFGLLFAAGVALGIVYPKTMENAPGPEIGKRPVYTTDGGFLPWELPLSQFDGAVTATVELRSLGPLRAAAAREMLVLTVHGETGNETFRASLDFPAPVALESPQTGIYLHRAVAGPVEAANGDRTFVVGAGRDFDDSVLSVDLILRAQAYRLDPRIQPAGFVLMAVGLVGFGLSLRRRRDNPNSSPPPSWGRR